MSAGELRERLLFQERRTIPDDGYGNREGNWRVMFETRARVRPLVGSETVIASRLAGLQPYRLTVRSNETTRQITPGWRAVDSRDTSRIFNITAIANMDERSKYLDIMAQTGVPT